MLTTLIIVASIAQILLSLFIVSRDGRNVSNLLFFFIGVSAFGWSLANYLSVIYFDSTAIIYIVRVILFFVVLHNAAFYLFAKHFPSNQLQLSKKHIAIYSFITLLVAAATITPFVFTNIDTSEGIPVTTAGPGILLFVSHATYSIIAAFIALRKKLKVATGILKRQLQVLFIASIIIWVLVPITNFAVTALFKTQLFIVLSPVYTLLFVSIIAYAIVSQRLFDVRAAAARTVAYVFSLGFIGLVYGVIIFALFSFVNFETVSDGVERGVYVALALVTSTAYPMVKKYFDRLTTRLFYQDAYDSQEFLDEINTLLVGQIELEQLLKGITDVIEQNLKSEYCVFVVRETAYEGIRIVGSEHHAFNEEKIKELRSIAPQTHRKVLATDELDQADEHLKTIQESLDIAVLIRLISNVGLDTEGMGYLVLGPKKNGTAYSGQDRQLLNILANEMIIAVENALRFEEIEKFNITLQDKVDSATSELKRTNEKLKEMDETKDEFISMASHQLRTPLTSVKGYLSMVLEGDVGKVSKQQEKMLEQAFLSSQRMVYLIADLLNVSRLKTGKFIIDTKETNLADVIETEVQQLLPTATSRNLKLSYAKPKDFPNLYLDETKMRQVIMNFIDNAIYYTPEEGEIKVTLEDKGDTIEYRVKDNGIGVPKSERHNLFSKFYRAGNARSARPDGTGLGLFMAKKVIVAQGGAIIFESEEGKGSTFGFTFAKDKLKQIAEENEATTKK